MRYPLSSAAALPARVLVIALLVATVATAVLVTAPRTASAAPMPPWFGPNVKVDAWPSYNAITPSIALGTNGVAYMAYGGWAGTATGYDIFFTKSGDGGRTWSTPMRVNNDAGGATQSDPSLAVDRFNNIYVTWSDTRGGSYDVFFAKSTDGGLSFSSNVRVNNVTVSFQWESAVAVDPVDTRLVHVVWTDNRNLFGTGPDIFYANSTDGGLSFNTNQRLNNDAGATEQARPALAVAPDRSVYVVWDDPRNGARGRDIFFTKSMDLGSTWFPNSIVSDDTSGASQDSPAIAVNSDGGIFVAWTDYRNANTAPDIYASRSTNGGASFTANGKVNNDVLAAPQLNPAIAARPGQVAIAWMDARTSGSTSYDIYWASSPDGIAWAPSQKVNDDTLPTNFQQSVTIAFDPFNDLFAAWFDQRSTGADVYAAALDVHAPAANPGPPMTIAQGDSAPFDGSASSDNFGIAAYAWDFGDGGAATGVSGTHVYMTPGTYMCSLTVWDRSGNADTATVLVTVRDTIAPTIRGAGDRIVDEGQPLFFDASASTDNVGVTSYAWDFGDGATGTGPAVTHIYATAGTHTATLTVSDAAGNTATATMTVTVRAVSPKASELLAQIQGLALVVVLLGVMLAIVGYMAFTMWRHGRPPKPSLAMRPTTPPPPPPTQGPGAGDPLDMPPPPEEPKVP